MNSSPHVQSPVVSAHPLLAARPSWFWPILGAVVGAVFIYAGVLKALDPLHFAIDIQNFRILPWPLAVRLAFYLPWLEILCGLALIVGWLRSGAVTILGLLMLIFLGATVAAKARGIDLACGCFGSASKNLSFTSHLLIDLAILVGLITLWFRPRRAPLD